MANAGTQIKLQGCTAGADYSATTNQYKFVKLSAARTVVLCAAATDRPIGVLQNTPKSGMPAEVVMVGETKVWAAAATVFNSEIGTDSGGLAAIYVPGTGTTNYICGTTIDSSAAAGGLNTAVINCISPQRGA